MRLLEVPYNQRAPFEGPWTRWCGRNRFDYRGQAPCVPRGIFNQNTRNAWAQYTTRTDALHSTFRNSAWKLSAEGVQTGIDMLRTRRDQFGLLFGYDNGTNAHEDDRVKGKDLYTGFYGAHIFRNDFDLRGAFAYGWQDYDMLRMANDVAYTAKFKGHTAEINAEVGKRFGTGTWSVRPVFGFDVMTNDIKAARETGADGRALSYTKSSLTQTFVRTGTELRYQKNRLTLNGGVFYAYDMNGQIPTTHVTYAAGGGPTGVLHGAKLGRELLLFNASGEFHVSSRFSLFGAYQGEYVGDRGTKIAQHTGYFGGVWKW